MNENTSLEARKDELDRYEKVTQDLDKFRQMRKSLSDVLSLSLGNLAQLALLCLFERIKGGGIE